MRWVVVWFRVWRCDLGRVRSGILCVLIVERAGEQGVEWIQKVLVRRWVGWEWCREWKVGSGEGDSERVTCGDGSYNGCQDLKGLCDSEGVRDEAFFFLGIEENCF